MPTPMGQLRTLYPGLSDRDLVGILAHRLARNYQRFEKKRRIQNPERAKINWDSECQAFLGLNPGSPNNPMTLAGVWTFAVWLAERLRPRGTRGFTVRLMLSDDHTLQQLGDYVSWLHVDSLPTPTQFGELTIVVHLKRVLSVASQLEPTPSMREFVKSGRKNEVRRFRDMFAKIVLHETGHAVLHLHEYLAARKKDHRPYEVDEEDEREAWLFSLGIWELIVADLSVHRLGIEKKYPTRRDVAWKIA